MDFFVGLHQPSDARHFERAFISVNRLWGKWGRKSPFAVKSWMLDSAGFSEIAAHGDYRSSPAQYAALIARWSDNGILVCAVTQDYMCEETVLARTGMCVSEHQRKTIERYDALLRCDTGGTKIMPVLQGYAPAEYVRHVQMYGRRLRPGMRVGVGSVCKRNGEVGAVAAVLLAIKHARPDLRLHGFGLKTTALSNAVIRSLLASADSMAWSFAARRQGRNANDWREAERFRQKIEGIRPMAAKLISRPCTGLRMPKTGWPQPRCHWPESCRVLDCWWVHFHELPADSPLRAKRAR
jgi:hypothetical protein